MRSRVAPAIVAGLMCFGRSEYADAGQGRGPTLPSASLPGSTATATPRVACGMTLVPVRPTFDPKIRKPAPDKPKPASRSVAAPRCN